MTLLNARTASAWMEPPFSAKLLSVHTQRPDACLPVSYVRASCWLEGAPLVPLPRGGHWGPRGSAPQSPCRSWMARADRSGGSCPGFVVFLALVQMWRICLHLGQAVWHCTTLWKTRVPPGLQPPPPSEVAGSPVNHPGGAGSCCVVSPELGPDQYMALCALKTSVGPE